VGVGCWISMIPGLQSADTGDQERKEWCWLGFHLQEQQGPALLQ